MIRGAVKKHTVYLKTLSKYEGGRSIKRNAFLTKAGEGGGHKTYCMIY